MGIEIESIGEALNSVRFDPEPEIYADVHVPIQGGQTRVGITREEHDLWRKVENAFRATEGNMLSVAVKLNNAGMLGVAYQELTVAASNLTTTVVANDTLITASQSDVEFNWNDPRLQFGRSVNLEPALGVEQMGFVLDTGAHINPAVLHSVDTDGTISHNLQMDCVSTVPGQNTYLMRRQWSNASGDWDLDAKAWEVGQKLHLVQLRILEATELT